LPGFGKAVNSTSFKDDGKYDSHKQCLNRWFRWSNGFRGRCLRYSFGMPSIQQAFFGRVYYFLYITRPYPQDDCCLLPQTRPVC
jgi:hypothetical protein